MVHLSAVAVFVSFLAQTCDAGPATCDTSVWTDMSSTTGCPRSCMALTTKMSKYKTCRNWCAEQQNTDGGGLDCVGAWDDLENQCTDAGGDNPVTAPTGQTTCDFDFGPLGTSDAVCECKAPEVGRSPILADQVQMDASPPCGDSTLNTQGQQCFTEDNDAQLSSVLKRTTTCAEWVPTGMPEVQDAVKGKGCGHCVGAGTVQCIMCPKSCMAASTTTTTIATTVTTVPLAVSSLAAPRDIVPLAQLAIMTISLAAFLF